MSASGTLSLRSGFSRSATREWSVWAEPHDYGVIDGTERLLIFQLHGPDSGRPPSAGGLLDVVKIESCVVTDQTFAGSRGQSHQKHYQGETLYARVT